MRVRALDTPVRMYARTDHQARMTLRLEPRFPGSTPPEGPLDIEGAALELFGDGQVSASDVIYPAGRTGGMGGRFLVGPRLTPGRDLPVVADVILSLDAERERVLDVGGRSFFLLARANGVSRPAYWLTAEDDDVLVAPRGTLRDGSPLRFTTPTLYLVGSHRVAAIGPEPVEVTEDGGGETPSSTARAIIERLAPDHVLVAG